MASAYVLPFLFLLTQNLLSNCASAAVHTHSLDSQERAEDGAFRARDAGHYDEGHNSEFDHEAILGSVREAEEFEKLSPDEAKRRLGELLPRMDRDGDQHIDHEELKDWILNSFQKLSREEAQERMKEADQDGDGAVTWPEYLHDAFGVDDERDAEPDDTGDSGLKLYLVYEEKKMFNAADMNGDGKLDLNEFEVFSTPEEHSEMHAFLVNQTLREKDLDKDGRIDFHEFLNDRGKEDPAWKVAERDRFDNELDRDGDGFLDAAEIKAWIVPDNHEIATEEVEHLFEVADDDGDGRLSFAEVLAHHQQFVGSEATDYGNDLLGEHFDDEL